MTQDQPWLRYAASVSARCGSPEFLLPGRPLPNGSLTRRAVDGTRSACGYRDVVSVASGSVERMFEDAVEVRDRLAVLVDRLDPDAVSGSAARDLWGVLDASELRCF
jgi:hypothetical protein